MKAQNLFIAFVTFLMVSYGSLALGDDVAAEQPMVEKTVNINSDDAETLAKNLIGVGLSRAKAIVDYRDNYGPFFSAEELSAVKGIGMATVEKNASRIVVE